MTLINDDVFGSHTIANGTWASGTPQAGRETGAPAINNVQISGSSSAAIGPFTTAGIFKVYCTITEQATAHLLEQRERYGLSYLQISVQQMENFAPVLAQLAGL